MTQKEIARKLNVSQATVSMALKGSARISQTLRDSVRKLADDSGYLPNLAGQLLRQGRSNVIGIVFPSLVNSFYAELYQELQRKLQPHGYLLYLSRADTPEELSSTAAYLRQLQVAGVVALGSAEKELRPLRESGIALVFYGGEAPLEGVSQVLPDRYRAGLELTRFLLSRKRTRIAFIGMLRPEEQRVKGYRDALAEAGIAYDPKLTIAVSDSMGNGYTAMRKLLKEHPDIDGVFTHNDEMAIGALRAAAEAGIRVPEQLSLAGFDSIETGRYLSPALTTVEQPLDRIADALVSELLAVMADPKHNRFVSIPCRMVERESA